jgi:type II secretory pathway pseudopilin PulG
VQRLQVGVFGLAAMVLLVGLANIIKTNADQTEAQVVPQAAPAAIATDKQEASDPLADAGVVPDLPTQNKVKDAAAAAAPHPNDAPAPAARP